MRFLALLLAAQMVASPDTVPPYLTFPEPGLDDPAAYQGYATRVFRDAKGNAFQVYVNGRIGRVVNLWADAADESVGFTVRDSAGAPAALDWASSGALAGASPRGSGRERERSVSYGLGAGPGPVSVGLFLLGSMRVERDFQYQGRDSLPLDATPFLQGELVELIANLERLDAAERRRHLRLLGARSAGELRARLAPRVSARARDGTWAVRVEQVSFDGRSHLSVAVEGDARETVMTRTARSLIIRSRSGRPVRLTVRVTTDAPALSPLTRAEIFNDDFRRFVAAVRADTAHPLRFRRLEREVRGVELLCSREKLMAGLPNFATYFGRDMLMTALLMQPVWAPAMPEHVIASALRKLSPDGDVSHEEALGGQAIRENAAEYNRLLEEARSRSTGQAARDLLGRARAVLGNLQAVRENYIMIDDDFQLPVVAARYLADPRVPSLEKRRFLLAERRLPRLVANLAFVARQAEPYARAPAATSLVSFPHSPDGGGHWISASWRDSRAGYAGGRFAMDVNVIWVPHALEGVGTILDALEQAGFTATALDSLAPAIRRAPLATYARDRAALRQAVAVWKGAERHFQVALPPDVVTEAVAAKLRWLPPPEGDYWESVRRRAGPPSPTGADTLRFLALSLDAEGRPIPIVNTDPAMLLLLDPLGRDRTLQLVGPIMLRYPWGLFVEDLGPLAANDAYASPDVWDSFRRDRYHSPTVVWGRDVNALLAGLATQILAAAPGSDVSALQDALRRTVTAVERSGLRHAELWSYRIDAGGGRLLPERYGTSSDVQLWSLTDLAVEYLLARLPQP